MSASYLGKAETPFKRIPRKIFRFRGAAEMPVFPGAWAIFGRPRASPAKGPDRQAFGGLAAVRAHEC
jgi:hypothetical protein